MSDQPSPDRSSEPVEPSQGSSTEGREWQRHYRWHGPPRDRSEQAWPRRWPRHGRPWARNRRFVFFGFALLFGGMALLFLAGLGGLLYLLQALSTNWQSVGGFALALCAVPLILLGLSAVLGRWGFRRMARPVADLMSAVDAVAEGDLSVRLEEDGRGDFGRLAHSFNRMASELQRAEQQRRNLTADIAHELRNPLHILQGNLEGMLDGVYEPSTQNLTATLEETRLLGRLVSDLQTLSLAESGQLPLHPARILAADLLADVVASFSARATEQGIDLRVELPAGAESLELNADPDRLDQVLSNLVVNALHHTASGGSILLQAEAIPGGVRLSVSDTGIGIPPEDLPYIFDRFWRGDRSRTRSEGTGSGLGLAIARQLVQAHGGTISADSSLGAGTTIRIDLPTGSAA